MLVKEVDTPRWNNLDLMTAVGDVLYFVGEQGSAQAIWRSDGTESGTFIVDGYMPRSATPRQLTAVGNLLFFVAPIGTGSGVWRTDGTAEGTAAVTSILNIISPYLTNVSGQLFFTAGQELWTSDGSQAGTLPLRTVSERVSVVKNLVNVDGTLFFSADREASGFELWTTNGQSAGTFQLTDITGDEESSLPAHMVRLEDRVLMSAYHSEFGRELWSLDLGDLPPWSNPMLPTDVDNSGEIAPLDALRVINELTDRQYSSTIDGSLLEGIAPPAFLDVNDDGFISPIDALAVINNLPADSSRTSLRAPAWQTIPKVDEDQEADEFTSADNMRLAWLN